MNLLAYLCAAYDVISESEPLPPPFHAERSAALTIRLSLDGGFLGAERLSGERIIIPVTEASASRTSTIAPHPLSDTLRYIASDFPDSDKRFFTAYERLLSDWAKSPFSCEEICVVLAYIRQGTVFADLLSQAISTDSIMRAAKMLVSFTVGDISLCKSEKIRSLYIRFAESRLDKSAFSFVSGKHLPAAKRFPSGLMGADDRAKLLSSNDITGFTFRGRFFSGSQAFSIGAEESHKLHAALAHLAAKSAFTLGRAKYIVWRTDGKPPLDFFASELSPEAFMGAETLVMKLEAVSTGRLAIRYVHKSDMSGLLFWLETCRWRFSGKEKTPPLSSFQRLGGGDIIDVLLPCALERYAVPRSAVRRICSCAMKAKSCSELFAALGAACALAAKYRTDCGGGTITPTLSETENDSAYLFGRIFAFLMHAERNIRPHARRLLCMEYLTAFAVRPVHTLSILRARLESSLDGETLSRMNAVIRRIPAEDFRDKPLDFTFLCGLYCQLDAQGELPHRA